MITVLMPALIAQMEEHSPWHARGRGFESRWRKHLADSVAHRSHDRWEIMGENESRPANTVR